MRWRRAVEVRVMQHCAVLVQADDAGIGQFGVDRVRCLQVGLMDAELTGAGAERRQGGAMRPCAGAAGLAQQRQLVRRLDAAMPVQVVEHGRRVQGGIGGCAVGGDHRAPAWRQFGQRGGGTAHGDNFEVLHPVAAGRLRHHVPVVARLQEDQFRPRARRVRDPAARRIAQRQPVAEVRVGHERVVLVIQKLARRHAGGNQQVVEAGQRERGIGPLAQRGQMRGIERGKRGGVHGVPAAGRAERRDQRLRKIRPP